jgi:glycosyltransferase involved in cell wall biosynthesis
MNIQIIKISIIIPCYNIEDYIAKCLQSILEQDMPDFEIIAINDGSTDQTPYLLEEYAKNDSRIQILHLENGGQSRARNHGILKATGEYLMFVDGDDFILPGALSSLYHYIKSNNADCVIFSHLRRNFANVDEQVELPYPKDVLMTSLTAAKCLLLSGHYYVCNKIIDRKFYLRQNIFFEEGVVLEDIPVSFQLLSRAQRIVYTATPFYVYVRRKTSTMENAATFKRVSDHMHAYDCVMKELEQTGLTAKLDDAFRCGYIRTLIDLLRACYKNPENYKSREDFKMAELLLKERLASISLKSIFFNPYVKFSLKMNFIRLNLGLYKWEKIICGKFKNFNL